MVDYTPNEMMTVAAARALKDDDVCFVGIGMPSAAANLARLTHAPNITLIYESGTLATKPNILPLSIGDGELAETADAVVSVPEMFAYWLQGERIDVGFLGAASIALVLGYDVIGWTLGLLVAGLALAAAATGICAGCEIYKLLARVRGIELCATCVGGTALPSEE